MIVLLLWQSPLACSTAPTDTELACDTDDLARNMVELAEPPDWVHFESCSGRIAVPLNVAPGRSTVLAHFSVQPPNSGLRTDLGNDTVSSNYEFMAWREGDDELVATLLLELEGDPPYAIAFTGEPCSR